MKPYLIALKVWLDLRNSTGVNIYCILMVIRYSLNTGIQCLILKLSEDVYGYLPFTCKIQKFWLENQMFRAILFGQIRKSWAVILGYAIFLHFFGCTLRVALPPCQILKFCVYEQDFHPGGLC